MTRVACIVPTYGRPDWHAHLYAVFAAQTHPDKILVVADDSPAPSPFFTALRDPRVRYQHAARRSSIGEKRNDCIRRAPDAAIIAHFDDDDWYAPDYLARMLAALDDNHADLVKLAVWNAVCPRDGSRWQWDTRHIGGVHCAVDSARCFVLPDQDDAGPAADACLWGYGFSYVYRRTAWARVPFPNRNTGEDYAWLRAIRAPREFRAQGARCVALSDRAELVWHTVHPRSTSRMFPQRRLDAPTPRPVNGGQAFVLPALFDAVGGSFRAPRNVAASRKVGS